MDIMSDDERGLVYKVTVIGDGAVCYCDVPRGFGDDTIGTIPDIAIPDVCHSSIYQKTVLISTTDG